jgi:DNA-binding transcriptional ArsR family regulator
MIYEDAIAALADPSRRAIIERLRTGALPVGKIASELPISRPAVSQHLKVLSDAGLVNCDAKGNRRLYGISPDGVAALRKYLDCLWDDALACFSKAAEAEKGTKSD